MILIRLVQRVPDQLHQHSERNDLFSTNMDKAGSKLRQHNFKNKKRSSGYEVQRDPLDGNVYVHVDPDTTSKLGGSQAKKH